MNELTLFSENEVAQRVLEFINNETESKEYSLSIIEFGNTFCINLMRGEYMHECSENVMTEQYINPSKDNIYAFCLTVENIIYDNLEASRSGIIIIKRPMSEYNRFKFSVIDTNRIEGPYVNFYVMPKFFLGTYDSINSRQKILITYGKRNEVIIGKDFDDFFYILAELQEFLNKMKENIPKYNMTFMKKELSYCTKYLSPDKQLFFELGG